MFKEFRSKCSEAENLEVNVFTWMLVVWCKYKQKRHNDWMSNKNLLPFNVTPTPLQLVSIMINKMEQTFHFWNKDREVKRMENLESGFFSSIFDQSSFLEIVKHFNGEILCVSFCIRFPTFNFSAQISSNFLFKTMSHKIFFLHLSSKLYFKLYYTSKKVGP